MTDSIFSWRLCGYRPANGPPVQYADLFQTIDRLCLGLNQCGVEALFWHVPPALNQGAHMLANNALDRVLNPTERMLMPPHVIPSIEAVNQLRGTGP
ncbi:ribonuclease HI [Microdochium nivale]|nr:ribonuclease HI [Microdochium nivale]